MRGPGEEVQSRVACGRGSTATRRHSVRTLALSRPSDIKGRKFGSICARVYTPGSFEAFRAPSR